jgi:type VI secretion system protein ImpC
VGRRGRGPIPAPAAQSPLALAADRIAERIDDQLAALLQHPRLRRAEATLRSLRLLCGRTDFRRRIRLDVLHLEADRARTDETLAAVLEASDHHLILVGWELDPGADLELLQWLGEQGDALQAPVLFSVARAFLGLEGETPRLPSGLFEQPRYQGWNALREQECARWLAGSFNRFLLRPPHRRRAGSDLLDDHLFGEPAWLLGALIVQSFARSGWPTEISGTSGGRIDDLPLRDLELRGRGRIQTPLEFPLEQRAVEDLVRAGLCALFAPEDSDRAFVLAAPTLFCLAEQKPAPLRARSIGLPYQLLAARLARAVAELKPELVGLGSVEAVRTRLGRFLEDLLSDTGAGSSVAVEVVPGSQTVRLELRTGKAILGGVRLELGFQLLG